MKQVWQSKLVLLVVMPVAGAGVVLESHWWAMQAPSVAIWTVGSSLLLGLVTWKLRAATPWGAAAGTAITASLMFSTVTFPYTPWHTALMPVLAVAMLAFLSTLLGRGKKEQLGTAEDRHGRSAAQVSANLGVAALMSSDLVQSWFVDSQWFTRASASPMLMFSVGLAALSEAAADTSSSEVGQVFGGRPRMITTLRQVEPGRNGAVSLAGTLGGVVAAVITSAAGTLALRGDRTMFAVSCAGGVFGLLFDSLLGATLEERGWLNNDAVNFLSTASAAGFALGLLVLLPQFLRG
ncbi:MAG TPA: DUF92 domain-containing protein [Terracidiphilus sp.]|nr:DUF92 domain-containing protein [Terracidiphilus sp.]